MDLIGHRGCGAQYPENTVYAVRQSARYLDTVELDVRRCASGELVVFHDETVDRVTDGEGAVADLAYDDLRDLEVLDSGESIPTLDDALAALPADVTAQLELKETGLAADARECTAAHDAAVRLSSFHPDALREAAATGWDAPRGLLFETDPLANVARAADLGCEYVHPHFDLCLDTDVVETAHAAGMGVIAWKAARTPEDVAALRDAGVDGVTADRWDIA